MTSTRCSAVTLLPLLCMLAIPAWGQTDRSVLLSIESRSDLTFSCEGVDTETLVLQDGLVISKRIADKGEIEILRLTASSEALRRLRSALRRNRVGIAEGDCAVDFRQPNLSFTETITWVGNAGRNHTFTVTSSSVEPCPDSTGNIFNAISEFIGAAYLDPLRERVVFHVAPHCK
jgi:hypothetical protein